MLNHFKDLAKDKILHDLARSRKIPTKIFTRGWPYQNVSDSTKMTLSDTSTTIKPGNKLFQQNSQTIHQVLLLPVTRARIQGKKREKWCLVLVFLTHAQPFHIQDFFH